MCANAILHKQAINSIEYFTKFGQNFLIFCILFDRIGVSCRMVPQLHPAPASITYPR